MPEDVFTSSKTERAWWQCSAVETRVWEAKIHTIHHNKKASPENCLQTKRPDLAQQWHPTKKRRVNPKQLYRFFWQKGLVAL